MFDYEFVITNFDGGKHYYTKRFNKELSDEETQETMNGLFKFYKDAKYIMLNRMFPVKK